MESTEVARMRNAIAECYGPKWKDKVSKMASKQVMAIYFSFKKRKLIA